MALPFSAYMQPQLALTNFRLRSRPKSQPGPLLELKGRPSGVFYTILNLFGLSPIAELKVNNTEIRQHTKNLLGDLSHIIPLRHVDSVGFGSSKPILYLVLAVNCLFLGGAGAATIGTMALIGGLVGACLFFILFFLGQSFVLTFNTASTALAIRFKSGSGKGKVDWKLLLQSVEVIRDLLTDANLPGGSKTHSATAEVDEYEEEDEDEEEDEFEDEPPPPRRGPAKR